LQNQILVESLYGSPLLFRRLWWLNRNEWISCHFMLQIMQSLACIDPLK